MPCFSMRAMRSASVRSRGGLVSPSTISTVVGWKRDPFWYRGITWREGESLWNCFLVHSLRTKALSQTARNGQKVLCREVWSWQWGATLASPTYVTQGDYLITPLVIGIHFQVISGQDHESLSNELLVGNVDLHSCFLSFGILRAASQEVAHDELVESLLVALRSSREKGECPPRLTRDHKISGILGEDFVLMTTLRLSLYLSSNTTHPVPSGYTHL